VAVIKWFHWIGNSSRFPTVYKITQSCIVFLPNCPNACFLLPSESPQNSKPSRGKPMALSKPLLPFNTDGRSRGANDVSYSYYVLSSDSTRKSDFRICAVIISNLKSYPQQYPFFRPPCQPLLHTTFHIFANTNTINSTSINSALRHQGSWT
jgi:hypothetical protein